MKRKIQITMENIPEIFALPCVTSINKRIVGQKRKRVVYDSSPVVWLDDYLAPSPKPWINTATVGDWLEEDDDGFWYVMKNKNDIYPKIR